MGWFGLSDVREELKTAQQEARDILEKDGKDDMEEEISSRAWEFASKIPEAFGFIIREPDILFFAILQWVVIGLSYRLWIEFLDWIPQSVWDNIRQAEDAHQDTRGMYDMLGLLLLGWSFLVVCVASYPLALLNAATICAVNLKKTGKDASISSCLMLAAVHIDRLWAFTTIDGWITVNQILERLPKKNDHESMASKAAKELLYYAWKLGTIGILPALVNGRGFLDAGKESVDILRKRFQDAAILRFGYSAVCWPVGILSYIGAVVYYRLLTGNEHMPSIYNFYKMMGMPIFVAVGATVCLIRPFFMVLLAQLYSEIEPLQKVEAGNNTGSRHISLMLFLVMLGALLASAFFGDQLGIRHFVSSVAAKGPGY